MSEQASSTPAVSGVFRRLSEARVKLHSKPLERTGQGNRLKYFELADFIPQALTIFQECGLCGVVSFGPDLATLTIYDVFDGGSIVITTPMEDVKLPNCQPAQNNGAAMAYHRRYLWLAALEIVENDQLDFVTANSPQEKKPASKPVSSPSSKPSPFKGGSVAPSASKAESASTEEMEKSGGLAASLSTLKRYASQEMVTDDEKARAKAAIGVADIALATKDQVDAVYRELVKIVAARGDRDALLKTLNNRDVLSGEKYD